MDKKELAERLNGREYRSETYADDIKLAQENGLVIVYGCSDDLMELEGAITDEGDCYGGESFLIDIEKGILKQPNQDDYDDTDEGEDEFYVDFKKYKQAKKSGRFIVAEWCKEDGYSWTYTTSIPHETFDILEDGDKYCRGIVFSVHDV